tara:strand:- start:51 stop:989 length:939 start_codon:yes stop_codon:yes gene_type:complete
MNISGTEVEIVTNPYSRSVVPIDSDFEDSIQSVLVKGAWNDGIVDLMLEQNIKGLYLNSAKGFKCDDFSFLRKLPQLELLNIIYSPVESLSEIEQLTQLKSLSISCHWEERINLSNLNNLERCFINYGKGADSIFSCSNLKYLYIDEFKLKSFDALKELENLEYLTIGNSSFNQTYLLPALKKLRKLVLLNCRKLDQIKGIDQLSKLEWLTIEGSRKLSSIQELKDLENLLILQLSDNKEIESLAPIKKLTQLKALCFFGDTVFKDGDLAFLESFSSLSLVGFAGRKHYTHKPSKPWNWDSYESNEIAIIRK